MTDLAAAIVADLTREIAFAGRVSPFYEAVFRIFRDAFTVPDGGDAPRITDGVAEILALWEAKTVTAWFERPLLLGAALHRVALADPGGPLGRFYATCGGGFTQGDEPALRSAILSVLPSSRSRFLDFLGTQSLQTNEISRGLTWLLPAAAAWERTPRPVVLVELGCSAGLNLLADHYGWRLEGDGRRWHLPGIPTLDARLTAAAPEDLARTIDALGRIGPAIRRRIGCDLHIPDVDDADARGMLESMIWGDNPARLSRLRQALERLAGIRTDGTLELHRASAQDFVPRVASELARTLTGEHLILFFNTVVTCYFDDDAYAALESRILAAALGPLRNHHVLWIEHEPARAGTATATTTANPSRNESTVVVRWPTPENTLASAIVAHTEMHPRTFQIERLDPDRSGPTPCRHR